MAAYGLFVNPSCGLIHNELEAESGEAEQIDQRPILAILRYCHP